MAGVLSHEEAMALIRQAQAGDAQALERMVGANLALVRSVCGRFAGRGCEMEELYQLGALGLVKAIRNFRVELNVRFSTYAVPMIMGEIRRFLRDDGPLSVSRRLKETAARAARVAEALRQALLREPTLPEIAQALRCDEHELVMALESASAVASLAVATASCSLLLSHDSVVLYRSRSRSTISRVRRLRSWMIL